MAEAIGATIGVIVVIVILLTPPALVTLLIVWLVRRNRRADPRRGQKTGASPVPPAASVLPSTTSTPLVAQVEPGWYPDALAGGENRWWTGSGWGNLASDYSQPNRGPAEEPEVEVAPQSSQPPELKDVDGLRPLTRREMREAERAAAASRAIEIAKTPLEEIAPSPGPAAMPNIPPAYVSVLMRGREETAAAPPTPAPQIKPRVIRAQAGEWIPSGMVIEIAGYVITGGMVYVGRQLRGRYGNTEPALIDSTLKVKKFSPDFSGRSLGYWPGYDSITPEARAAYLSWLAEGRRKPNAAIGYVFLFMYGLERRILVDTAENPAEIVSIRAEMHELRGVYASQSASFDRYSANFVELLDLLLLEGQDAALQPIPALTEERWPIPLALQLQIGARAFAGVSIPADWAFAWAWFNPELRPRTPGKRCATEYATLFRLYFEQRFPEGLSVKPLKRNVNFSYSPASSEISNVTVPLTKVSDVFSAAGPIAQLREISEQAQDALESYSRYLGKNPEAERSLEAVALLPVELIDADLPAIASLKEWAETAARDEPISSDALLALWGHEGRDRLTKTETVPIIQLLSKLGLGVEPDVRFGGPPLGADRSIVLFDGGKKPAASPSPEYETAQSLAHLAIAVSAADGSVAEVETATLVHHIESSLQLSVDERARLHAHLRWLASGDVKLTGLTKRVGALSDEQKIGLADLLIEIAASDGVVTPDEITILMKVFTLLGRDRNEVTGRVHAALSGGRTRTTAQLPTSTGGRAISPLPSREMPSPFALDTDVISSTIWETAKVSALLRDVFDDEEPVPASLDLTMPSLQQGSATDTPAPVLVGGLDAAHSALFHALAGRQEISRVDFDAFAAKFSVLPNGALDALNEAAFDVADEPLLEGDEVFTINSFAVAEMVP